MFEVVGFAGELCGEFNIRVGAIILGPWFCVPYDDMIEPIPPNGSEDAGVVVAMTFGIQSFAVRAGVPVLALPGLHVFHS